jgi:hypothetical protein
MQATERVTGQTVDEGPSARATVEALQQHLAFLYAEAGEVRPSGPEPDVAAIDALLARGRGVLASAFEALDVLAILYETSSLDDATPSPIADESSVEDVVVVAWLSLRERRAALETLGRHGSEVERLSSVDSAMHAVQKSLSAVERSLAAGVDAPPATNFHDEHVLASVELRRRYVRFHEAVVRGGAPPPELLSLRLRAIGDSVAELLGLAAPLSLRAADRAALVRCQQRLRDHRRLAPGADHEVDGRRLWQDLVHVSTMFLDVHKREEVVFHDARAAQHALARLHGAPPGDAAALAEILASLRVLEGRSPALDALLAKPAEGLDRAALRAALETIARAIGPGAGLQ